MGSNGYPTAYLMVGCQLDPLATSYLKKCAGLARCANPSILFLSKQMGACIFHPCVPLSRNFRSPKWHRCWSPEVAVLRRFVAGNLLQHEDSTSGRAFLPASVVKGVMVEHPGASKKKLKEWSTLTVAASDESNWLEKLQSLQIQGECFRLGADTFDIWSVAVISVTDIITKFSFNALMDTLSHRHNLLKWGKAQTCFEQLQYCPAAEVFWSVSQWSLEDDFYFIYLQMPDGFCVTSDLPSEEYIRPDFLMSDLRPDIVLWSTEAKTAVWTDSLLWH